MKKTLIALLTLIIIHPNKLSASAININDAFIQEKLDTRAALLLKANSTAVEAYNGTNPFSRLPPEIVGRILSFLDQSGLVAARQVCLRFYAIITDLKLLREIKLKNGIVDLRSILIFCPMVESLNFIHAAPLAVVRERLVILPSLLQLKRLSLSGNQIGPDGIALLAPMLPNLSLTDLDLGGNFIEVRGLIALANVLPRLKLTKLNLWLNGLMGGIHSLAQVLEFTEIMDLDISKNEIRCSDVEALASVLPRTKLKSLCLKSSGRSHEFFGYVGAEALAAVLENTQLTTLDIGGNHIQDRGLIALSAVLKRTKLRTLNLGTCSPGQSGAEALGEALKGSSITDLDYSNNYGYGVDVTSAIATALPDTNLTALNLYANFVKEEAIVALAAGLPSSQLTSLNFAGCHLESLRDKKVLAKTLAASLPACRQLTDLDLSLNNVFGDNGVEELSAILPDTALRKLNLSYNKIGPRGAGALAWALPRTQIIHLNLSGNPLEDKGVAFLAETFAKTKLEFLDLGSYDINNIPRDRSCIIS